ncbi:hypothetical protein F5J12DRAFT_738593 [Pisolithus orientalis]|uniref:uncharacterized protein n=1 Tax=Pisolithus orientalis TaxID=936130 RepID=UPI0022252C95|nr:uncharacterized protein F5J12DRAFT_738593 [Pisolithus orientalis]KAI6019760.1 hypothetical protein F5J12DRAFT_738593 [Pisolithus orientalis]
MAGANSVPSPPPGIPEASRVSTEQWKNDLFQLFRNAKDHFPDVVWDIHPDEDDNAVEHVWGHKAVVYARAPPSFQARYFSLRPVPVTSPTPYAPSPSPSPAPAQSTVSLSATLDLPLNSPSPSPSPFRSSSPSPSTPTHPSVLRIPINANPALFANELEYLYTGAGLGEAFEFLFDTSESRDLLANEDNRIDKLRKDLVYMWRSRLYSDVRISLTGNFSSSNPEHTTAVFSTHRFILISRSPCFRAQLLTWASPQSAKTPTATTASNPNDPFTIHLPSPPFTPASIHFTLGYIYTGTLHFSHRTFDLDTAFAILRASLYLSLPALTTEIQSRIVYEMLHGLFHAFLEFNAYESITNAKWGTGGCRCRQCARRVPRVLEFSVAEDVQNKYLERGARRALVGLFGEGWCTSEFAALPQKTRESVLKGLAKRTTPANVFPLLFAAQHALRKLDSAIDAWADIVREMVLTARKSVDECLVRECEACFEDSEWVSLLEGDGAGFGDAERVGWVMESLKRGMSEKYAGIVYQTIVSSILLRPHPTSATMTMLPSTSPIRTIVEDARVDLLKYIRKRWMNIRNEGGFDALDSWSLKEISQEIEVATEDLLSPPSHSSHSQGGTLRSHHSTHLSRALRSSLVRGADADSDTLSVHSLRASVLSKTVGTIGRDSGASSRTLKGDTASIRSVSRTTRTRNQSTPTPAGALTRANVAAHIRAHLDADAERPDSKLTPDDATSVRSMRSSATEKARAQGRAHRKSSSTSTLRTTDPVEETMDDSSTTPSVCDRPRSPSRPTPGFGPSGRPHLSKIVTTSTTSMRSTTSTQKSLAPSIHNRARPHNVRPTPGVSGTAHRSHAGLSTLRIPGSSRPTSTLSSATSDTGTFRTAQSEILTPTSAGSGGSGGSASGVRSRKISSGSTVSTVSTRTVGTTLRTPNHAHGLRERERSRVSSGVSINSVAMRPPARRTADRDAGKRSPAATSKRLPPVSSATPASRETTPKSRSISRTTSDQGSSEISPRAEARQLENEKDGRVKNKVNDKENQVPADTKQKNIPVVDIINELPERQDQVEMQNNLPADDDPVLARRGSADTITAAPLPTTAPTSNLQSLTLENLAPLSPPGASLEIGIPCIISSKRRRFRAFARYIGEVLGEHGPWVGVEVPMGAGDAWVGDTGDGRAWCDGTWGGVRYFDIGGCCSEWEFGDSNNGRGRDGARRRTDGINGLSKSRSSGNLKREGDHLSGGIDRSKRLRSSSPTGSDISTSESRGLFVRPQQVLYVVDAVGADL